jgi:hypothetical protein
MPVTLPHSLPCSLPPFRAHHNSSPHPCTHQALTILKPVEVMFDGLAVEGEGTNSQKKSQLHSGFI